MSAWHDECPRCPECGAHRHGGACGLYGGPLCETADWFEWCGHDSCSAIIEELTADELNWDPYYSRSAIDASRSGYGNPAYWAYLDRHARELAEKFPERGRHFMTQSLGEALAGNDGD